MGLKQFLKPNWEKIVLILILFGIGIVISILSNACIGCYDTILGFPLSFYVKKGWPPSEIGKTTFSIPNLIIDIVFWYVLSCLIVWIYKKYKKK